MKKFIWIMLAVVVASATVACQSSYLMRAIVYNFPSIEDYKIFPERHMAPAAQPLNFAVASTGLQAAHLDSAFSARFAVDAENLQAFLQSTQSTALIILKNDTILYEQYFNGYSRSSINTSFSTSKSITSLLVDIAHSEGLITSWQEPITSYLPNIKDKSEVPTIADLLNMTSGIAYDDDSKLFGDDAKSYYGRDLRNYALGYKMARKPGEAFKYNNINPLLVGMILEKVTGKTVAGYLEEKIWQPMGAEFSASWSLDEKGFEKMESGINARAIDFLKIGALALNEGRLNGQQIVPEVYLRSATQVDSSAPNTIAVRGDISYNRYWWIMRRYRGRDDFFAEGNLGQFIYVSPATRTVIVRHGKEYGYGNWPAFFYRMANVLDGLPPNENPFEVAYLQGGVQAAIALADSLRQSTPPLLISEKYLNRRGYALLSKERVDDAIAVFELNVRSYPQSYNVYDSLAEALLKKGDEAQARKYYLLSLQHNPENANAQKMLSKLE